MNIILNIDNFDINNIFFQESIKNTVISNSKFIRIYYSNNIFSLNLIFIKIPVTIISYEKFYNKYKCIINLNKETLYIKTLINIEKEILNKININKIKNYDICKTLYSNNINLFINNINKYNIISNYIIIKISGIWETDKEYGITYKFII